MSKVKATDSGPKEAQEQVLEPLVVTVTTRSPSTPSERNLEVDEIDTLAPRSAQELLRRLPGFRISQHGSEGKSGQLFFRGFDAAHGSDITVSIGGLSLNEPSHIHGHGYVDTNLLIPEALKSVRLRGGPFALDQGNLSTAGDVNFEIGTPRERRGLAIGAEAGWPPRSRTWATYAPRKDDGDSVTAVEAIFDNGPFENRKTRRGGVVHQQRLGDFMLRGGAHYAQFGLPGAIPLEDLEAGRIERGGTYSSDTSGRSAQLWLGTVHETNRGFWSGRTSLDMRGGLFDGHENFTGFLVDPDRGDETREYQRTASAQLAHRSRVELRSSWDGLLYGGLSVDRFRQFADAIDTSGQPFERRRGGKATQAGVHLAPGLDGFIADWLRLYGGIRFEALAFDYRQDRRLGEHRGRQVVGIAAPRGRVTVYAGDLWTMSAAAGRGFRGPEARVVIAEESTATNEASRRYRGGASEPTVVDAAEFGLIFEPHPGTHLAATTFGYFAEAEYVYDHVSRMQVDLGATRRVGIELVAQLQLGQWARLRAHLAATEARFVEDDSSLPFVAPLEGGASALVRLVRGWEGGLRWRALGARPLPLGAQAPGWSLLDAFLSWRSGPWKFSVHADNILDSHWYEGVYHYASHFHRDEPRSSLPSIHVVSGHPRRIRAGVTYRW